MLKPTAQTYRQLFGGYWLRLCVSGERAPTAVVLRQCNKRPQISRAQFWRKSLHHTRSSEKPVINDFCDRVINSETGTRAIIDGKFALSEKLEVWVTTNNYLIIKIRGFFFLDHISFLCEALDFYLLENI